MPVPILQLDKNMTAHQPKFSINDAASIDLDQVDPYLLLAAKLGRYAASVASLDSVPGKDAAWAASVAAELAEKIARSRVPKAKKGRPELLSAAVVDAAEKIFPALRAGLRRRGVSPEQVGRDTWTDEAIAVYFCRHGGLAKNLPDAKRRAKTLINKLGKRKKPLPK